MIKHSWESRLEVCRIWVTLALLAFPAAPTFAQDEVPAPDPAPTAAPAPAPAAPKHTSVYRSEFDKSIQVDRWSHPRTGKAPNGRRFLGEYSFYDPLYLTLKDLPEHRFVRVHFDLLILKSWDGCWAEERPDTWGIMESGGPLLLLTTFWNEKIGGGAAPHKQSYPDEFPHANNDSGTGASGHGEELGFEFRPDHQTANHIYKIDLIFPHTDNELVLRFFSRLTHHKDDESWGLDKVVVETADKETTLDEKQLDALWAQISGADPSAANRALWQVVAAGKKGLAGIDRRWQKFVTGEKGENADKLALLEKIEKILPGLTDESFIDRQTAQKELQKLGEAALEPLVAESKKTQDPELRRALAVTIKHLRKDQAATKAADPTLLVRSRVDHIRRIFETRENGYKVTSSVKDKKPFGYDSIGAPTDGYFPQTSKDGGVPRYTWFPRRGTEEWLQYDFPKPKTISVAEVFWFATNSKGHCSVPDSWRLLYQTEAGEWKPVTPEGDYGIKIDQMNQVTFTPVRTSAVRLEVQLPEGRSGGVHEFRVLEANQPAAK